MAFNKILPPVKEAKIKNGTAMIRVSVMETRKGNGSLRTTIILADTMLTSLPDYENIRHVVIYEGSDDDYGKLRVEFAKEGDEGAIKLNHFAKGGARIILSNKFEAMPKRSIGVMSAKLDSRDDTGFVIELPLLEWSQAGVLANKAQQQQQTQSAAVNRQERTEGKLYNLAGAEITTDIWCKPVEYLAKKGIRVAKMAGDFWQWQDSEGGERERITSDELLTRINKVRQKAGLRPIMKTQIVLETV